MGGTETPAATLEEARVAVARRAWGRAHELFAAVAAERPLGADDLERFAKAAYWIGAADGAISIRESAYEAFLASGDTTRAAFCALTLQRQHAAMLQDSLSAAWLARAEWLLAGAEESTAHGYLAIAHADAARARGDLAEALALVVHAVEIASRFERPRPSHVGPHAAGHVPGGRGPGGQGMAAHGGNRRPPRPAASSARSPLGPS